MASYCKMDDTSMAQAEGENIAFRDIFKRRVYLTKSVASFAANCKRALIGIGSLR